MVDNINDEEFLYRGINVSQWDFENNRPKSPLFKDSHGVSVVRDNLELTEEDCIKILLQLHHIL